MQKCRCCKNRRASLRRTRSLSMAWTRGGRWWGAGLDAVTSWCALRVGRMHTTTRCLLRVPTRTLRGPTRRDVTRFEISARPTKVWETSAIERTLTPTCCCSWRSRSTTGVHTAEGRFRMTYGDPAFSKAGSTRPNPSRPAPKCT